MSSSWKAAWFALAVVALVGGLWIGLRATDDPGPSQTVTCQPTTGGFVNPLDPC